MMNSLIKKTIALGVALGLCLGMAGAVMAQEKRGPGPGRMGIKGPGAMHHGQGRMEWWAKEKIQERMGLTEEQVAQISEIHLAADLQRPELEAQKKVLHLKLKALLKEETFSAEEAKGIIAELGEVTKQLTIIKLNTRVETAEILTVEQRQQAARFKEKTRQGPEQMGQRRERRQQHSPTPEAPATE